MGPTPVYGARAEKPLQNADFAMQQTNICRLSGDIMNFHAYVSRHSAIKRIHVQHPKSLHYARYAIARICHANSVRLSVCHTRDLYRNG